MITPTPTRRAIALQALSLAAFAAGAGQPAFATSSEPAPIVAPGVGLSTAVGTKIDLSGRVIAPVMVNGRGPFRFILDTGANRSVVSAALAQALALPVGPSLPVHGVTDVAVRPFALVAGVQSGAFTLRDALLPVLGEDMLGGADGMLGVDGLADLRIVVDVKGKSLAIERGAWGGLGLNAFSVPLQFRFNRLCATQAQVGAQPISVVFDTGADLSLANMALWRALQRSAVREQPITGTRLYSATRPIAVRDQVFVPSVSLSGVTINNVAAVADDFHVFALWGLIDRPALVLGMNVLGQLRKFSIDYGRRKMQLAP